MTKSKTKLLTVNRKGTVKRSVIRKAVEEVFGISAEDKNRKKKNQSLSIK